MLAAALFIIFTLRRAFAFAAADAVTPPFISFRYAAIAADFLRRAARQPYCRYAAITLTLPYAMPLPPFDDADISIRH